MSDAKGAISRRFRVGRGGGAARIAGRWVQPIAGATASCARPGSALRLAPLPPEDVGGNWTGTSKGLDRMLRAAALSLTCAALATVAAAAARVGLGRRRRPRVARPGRRARLRRGGGPARGRRGATTRSPPPARSCAPTIPPASCGRRSTRRSPRRATASPGRRTSRRGSARTPASGPPTSRPRSRRSRVDRRDQGRRGGQGGAPAVQGHGRRDVREALARRRRLRGRRRARHGHRHGRRLPGRRRPRPPSSGPSTSREGGDASPTPTATRTRSTTSTTTASATTTSTRRRSSTPPRAGPGAAQQLEQFKALLPGRQARADDAARSRPTATACRSTRCSPACPRARSATWRALAGGGSELLGELPGDAWAAFATPKVGESAKTMFDSFAGALGGAAIAAQVQQATGLNLRGGRLLLDRRRRRLRARHDRGRPRRRARDRVDRRRARGDGVRQARRPDRQGGGRAARADPDRRRRVRVPIAAPGAPQPVVLARGEGRVVAAYGEQAATDALDPATKLGDAALRRRGGLLDDLTRRSCSRSATPSRSSTRWARRPIRTARRRSRTSRRSAPSSRAAGPTTTTSSRGSPSR